MNEPGHGGEQVDLVVGLLDGLVEELESLDTATVAGGSGQAQENRAVRAAAAALARQRAQEARVMLAGTRERAVQAAAAARATRAAVRGGAASAVSPTTRALGRAAQALISRRGEEVDQSLELIVREALAAVPGVSRVGVSLTGGSGAGGSRAATDGVAGDLERLQADLAEGPGVDAARDRSPVLVPDLAVAGDRWPRFAPAAAALGVRTMCSIPLFAGEGSAGALDLYADAPAPWTSTPRASSPSASDWARRTPSRCSCSAPRTRTPSWSTWRDGWSRTPPAGADTRSSGPQPVQAGSSVTTGLPTASAVAEKRTGALVPGVRSEPTRFRPMVGSGIRLRHRLTSQPSDHPTEVDP